MSYNFVDFKQTYAIATDLEHKKLFLVEVNDEFKRQDDFIITETGCEKYEGEYKAICFVRLGKCGVYYKGNISFNIKPILEKGVIKWNYYDLYRKKLDNYNSDSIQDVIRVIQQIYR